LVPQQIAMEVAVCAEKVIVQQSDRGLRLPHIAKGGHFTGQFDNAMGQPVAKQFGRLLDILAMALGRAKQGVNVSQEARITRATRKIQIADDFVEKSYLCFVEFGECRAHAIAAATVVHH
jgi:hypothetical protein